MKKLPLLLSLLFLFPAGIIQSQGLEKIIVEKYYIADKQDAAASDGLLPAGSITYRIYADLKPGYKLQAVFGIEDHPLLIETTTGFYNHPVYGGNVPNIIPERVLNQDLVMLDSWLSMGAASEYSMGVLKEEDDTTNTIQNKYKPVPVLQNKSKKTGIPLSVRDGLYPKGDVPKVNGFGIDSLIKIFDKDSHSRNGVSFYTENGSWACLNGTSGPLESNRILIAQLTTDGKLKFEINIQIISAEGIVERFVALNPTGTDIQASSLIYP